VRPLQKGKREFALDYHLSIFITVGENTIWGMKIFIHCTVFQRYPCLKFNQYNIGTYFFKFLHNMINYNTKNSITKKFFFSTYIVKFQNIFVIKKCMSLCIKKYKYIPKMIEMIFSFYEICNIY